MEKTHQRIHDIVSSEKDDKERKSTARKYIPATSSNNWLIDDNFAIHLLDVEASFLEEL